MLDKIWRFIENIAASVVMTPFLILLLLVFVWGYNKSSFWIAEGELHEPDRLAYSIERGSAFIKKRGGEIEKIRNSSDCNGVGMRESWDERNTLRDSCIELNLEIGKYNKLVQPAYSITMSDPISTQIHREFDLVAMDYCDKYSGWR